MHVLDVIKKFFDEITPQFSTSPKKICTDNALEFIQNVLQYYCTSLDIQHQTSCSHTSQQNDVIEQKHKHILDVTQTIMLRMNVSIFLWSEVVLTTSYLINRMPSSVLGEEIPLRRLSTEMKFHLPP